MTELSSLVLSQHTGTSSLPQYSLSHAQLLELIGKYRGTQVLVPGQSGADEGWPAWHDGSGLKFFGPIFG